MGKKLFKLDIFNQKFSSVGSNMGDLNMAVFCIHVVLLVFLRRLFGDITFRHCWDRIYIFLNIFFLDIVSSCITVLTRILSSVEHISYQFTTTTSEK